MAKKFTDNLQTFEKLIKKDKIDVADIPDILQEYINTVGYVNFQKKLIGIEFDKDCDLKLKGVYELAKAIKDITNK